MAILPATIQPDRWADEGHDSLGRGPYFNNTIHNNHIHDNLLPPHIQFAPPHILQQYIQEKKIPKSEYKDQFHTSLDIQHFMPEEITVKVVNRFVVVEGEHSEKQDEHGWISRRFSRKYPVPEQYDLEEVQSNLSSDGVLTITIPRKYDPKHHREKPVKIEVTGKPVAREILEA
ncbi:alpha-crystallin A chain-like isoform X1 [Belonocnema kinseyi]|uniref:alpha-crystallin A chain-like isoform X1 n=1 Tax=Belonocnema kinseyi TaxID=2817044 RepID=UPI00143D542F|nr:alpha-crystallin A chain-like isoform X1 [Belonocnema kinseyi]XP_033211426.1 alpha-crystallin A chain-like isoform X1 [Belonocnema kinseyi]